jgi:hypothetical protein
MKEMKRSLFSIAAVLVLSLAACLPNALEASEGLSYEDEVATIVAATLSAELSKGAAAQDDSEVILSTPSLLPSSVYFLSNNAEGFQQIWRLEADGTTLNAVSPATLDVSSFDVSPTDGSLAYVSDNRLYLSDEYGEEARILIDASSADESAEDYYYRGRISSPRFSPDGGRLAFAMNGLQLLELSSGRSQLVLENQLNDAGSGSVFPEQLYFPESWSPNGSKVLVSISYLEAGTLAIYDIAGSELIALTNSQIVCCHSRWAADSGSILVASPFIGLIEPGLWRYDASTGSESVVINGSDAESVFNFVGWPLQVEGGKLYYFYTSVVGFPEGDSPLLMLQSDADGLSNRTQLRSDSFIIREALWAEDASLALIVQSQQGPRGPLVLAKADGSPLLILANDAQQLRWGP